jgi:D-serine deaminase-like pyridoxal phosphate-dependent protein
VIVDLGCLERNIAEMADLAREAGVALRPHIKTHKTPEIAGCNWRRGRSA